MALPVVPEARPRPTEGPGAVTAFVEGLSTYDATLEVRVGQGRVLTVKEDLAAGKVPALIAVGDPTVIEFVVVNARQIRIIGQRIGVTDLSLTTSDARTY
ncbi:MAG TPA: pilus assembly protein N-terminal domain-containing protein, partial [Isosphaeraceae bacterium]